MIKTNIYIYTRRYFIRLDFFFATNIISNSAVIRPIIGIIFILPLYIFHRSSRYEIMNRWLDSPRNSIKGAGISSPHDHF